MLCQIGRDLGDHLTWQALLVLLKCENKGSNISDAKLNGEGCLSLILAMSKSWSMREVTLGGGYFVVVAVDEGGTQFMSLLRNWDEIKWVAAGRSCGLAV